MARLGRFPAINPPARANSGPVGDPSGARDRSGRGAGPRGRCRRPRHRPGRGLDRRSAREIGSRGDRSPDLAAMVRKPGSSGRPSNRMAGPANITAGPAHNTVPGGSDPLHLDLGPGIRRDPATSPERHGMCEDPVGASRGRVLHHDRGPGEERTGRRFPGWNPADCSGRTLFGCGDMAMSSLRVEGNAQDSERHRTPSTDASVDHEPILVAIKGIRFGEVRIVIQNGVIIQMDRI